MLRKSQVTATLELMDTPSDRVRHVIGTSGLTQAAYATQIGLDATKLSKSLSGARRFSSLDLARIAELSGVTVDWLLTGVVSPLATAARASHGSSSGTALQIASELVELRESATRLGFPQERVELALPPLGGRAVEQGHALAAAALAHVRAAQGDSTVLDLAALIERCFGIDVCIRDLGDGFDGLAVMSPEASVILAGVTAIPYRQRFTLAHELGHILAGDDQGIHVDVDIFSAESRRGPSEMRANAFAAAFLMPADKLSGRVRPGFDEAQFAALVMELHVSPSALAIRLEDLRLIDGMARDRWQRLSAKGAAQLAGAARELAAATTLSGEARPPGPLSRDLLTAYLEDKTTLRPYANLMGVESARLRADLEREGGAS